MQTPPKKHPSTTPEARHAECSSNPSVSVTPESESTRAQTDTDTNTDVDINTHTHTHNMKTGRPKNTRTLRVNTDRYSQTTTADGDAADCYF